MNAGDKAVCILRNDDVFVPPPEAFLTLEKKVVNDSGGKAVGTDFNLSFDDGAGVSGSGTTGDAAITAVVVPPGLYNLNELAVAGYTLLEIVCNGLDSDGIDGLQITAGEKVTCTFVNDDKGVDIEIEKSVSNTSPNVGDEVMFSIVVKNNGPDNATDVRIVDVVKPGFGYVASSIAGGDIRNDSSPAGSGLDWGITNLAAGAFVTLTFRATVSQP